MKNINSFLANQKVKLLEKEIKETEAFAYLFGKEDKRILDGNIKELKKERNNLINQ